MYDFYLAQIKKIIWGEECWSVLHVHCEATAATYCDGTLNSSKCDGTTSPWALKLFRDSHEALQVQEFVWLPCMPLRRTSCLETHLPGPDCSKLVQGRDHCNKWMHDGPGTSASGHGVNHPKSLPFSFKGLKHLVRSTRCEFTLFSFDLALWPVWSHPSGFWHHTFEPLTFTLFSRVLNF